MGHNLLPISFLPMICPLSPFTKGNKLYPSFEDDLMFSVNHKYNPRYKFGRKRPIPITYNGHFSPQWLLGLLQVLLQTKEEEFQMDSKNPFSCFIRKTLIFSIPMSDLRADSDPGSYKALGQITNRDAVQDYLLPFSILC